MVRTWLEIRYKSRNTPLLSGFCHSHQEVGFEKSEVSRRVLLYRNTAKKGIFALVKAQLSLHVGEKKHHVLN